MDNLKIHSYNCRGLNNSKKRQDLFNVFKENNTDIVCLQETHFPECIENNIYAEWNGSCFLSHGTFNSKCVAILHKKQLDIKILNLKKTKMEII